MTTNASMNDVSILISFSFSGQNQYDVITGSEGREFFSLTLYENYVYWSDSKRGTIEKADKINGTNP